MLNMKIGKEKVTNDVQVLSVWKKIKISGKGIRMKITGVV